MSKFKHLFFDLDGTLTDSKPGVADSVKKALDKLSVNYDGFDFNKVVGPPLLYSFETFFGLSKEDSRQAVTYYRNTYETEGLLLKNSLYDGVFSALSALSLAGFDLCVVTSKPTQFAELVTSHFGIRHFFSHIFGDSFEKENTPKFEILSEAIKSLGAKKSECVMIGDRKHDLEAASLADISSIGVLYGYGDLEELSKFETLCLAESIEGVVKFFEDIA